ncbi:MAG TPA: C2H2-type zinc finger protein [Nitrososphaeraceae archaeon]
MERKVCQVCNKRFTRQWNLERHVKDIHHIFEYGGNDMVKQKYEGPSYSYSHTIKNEQFRNSENNTTDMNYYDPPEYHNFTNLYSNKDMYNKRFYPHFQPFPIDKKEDKLTLRDMRRIRLGLQILINFLQRIYPYQFVMMQICWLNYLCCTRKSIQPLRDFYQKNGLMHLWPLY